tara:strand:+ start:2841 stop:3416 length:576 start_codon:yes stop_codon:yes gene_type:complete
MDIERQIMEEIQGWSEYALEVPNPFFNDLPACPYAKSAWLNDKVGFTFSYQKENQTLYTALSQFDDTYDIVCCVHLQYEEDPEQFHHYIGALNEAISMGIFIQKDLWAMGFHPDDDQDGEVFDQSFEPVTDAIYAITFVQRLSKLEISAETLKKKGYYENYLSNPETAHLWDERQELYRRLCDAGNEQKNA